MNDAYRKEDVIRHDLPGAIFFHNINMEGMWYIWQESFLE